MHIPFSDIPGHDDLFLDYLYNFEKVERFYKNNFRDIENYRDVIEKVNSVNSAPRSQTAEIIKKQYHKYKPSKQTQYNLDLLGKKNTIAIVTGQQLGIFCGPLYTFYKIITAVKLCKHLKQNFDSYQFVPVFWLEGDDHDLDEIRSFNLITNNNDLFNISYEDGLPPEENRGPVGNIKFGENLDKVFEILNETLRDTEYKPGIMKLLKEHYKTGVNFKEAFANLLFDIFDEQGLIIFDPGDVEIKKLLIPVFKKEIEDFHDHTSIVVERSAELEETFHAQVKVKPINIFVLDENERLLLEPVETEFRFKGKRKKFSKEEILEMLQISPERFSPNVLLRPICQDYLLPTAVYVAGPGEISYFAQVVPFYNFYNLSEPIIYPRSSVTIVEKNIKDIIDKYGLTYKEIFKESDNLENIVINKLSEVNLELIFEKYLDQITPPINDLREKIVKIDPTLEDSVDKTMQRIEQTVNQLKARAENAEKRRFEAAIRQIEKTKSIIYPNNILQERELNFVYFVNKYGLEIIKWIINEVTINKFEHQILEL